MNYVDRFLSVCPIRKNQLQLLGTACLLLSSKLREPRPMAAEHLVFYTDNSISMDDLWVSQVILHTVNLAKFPVSNVCFSGASNVRIRHCRGG